MKLIIDRSRWLRGGKDGHGYVRSSTLRNGIGHMCCLGFYGEQLGCPLEGADPEDNDYEPPNPNWPRWLVKDKAELDISGNRSYLTEVCIELISTNDSQHPHMAEREREENIAALFAANGVDVVFVDKVES